MPRFNPFPPVSCRYGAPMGRHSHPGTNSTWDENTRLCARRQRGPDGGAYDEGGAYWGTDSVSGPVWAVWEHGEGANGVIYVRAWTRRGAVEAARAY